MGRFEEIIKEESSKEYYENLKQFVDLEYKSKTIFPKEENIFAALENTPYEEIKVVIIGQDPYHGDGEAHGLCFSVNKDIRIPPSLKNIYKEINKDLGLPIPTHGYLMKWARQGVLMLNSVLTVEKDKPGSHQKKGWEMFTNRIIAEVNKKKEPVVFLLWGNFAKNKKELITNPKHLILTSSHPSPFAVRQGFDGCSHFSKANKFLQDNSMSEIDWTVD